MQGDGKGVGMWNMGPQATETMAIIEAGSYVASDGTVVDISDMIEDAVVNTQILTADQLAIISKKLTLEPLAEFSDVVIRVTNETAQAALLEASWNGDADLLVLNFASAKRPGGGFLRDAKAQEEDLCRSSALFACIKGQYPFYATYHLNPTPLNSDHLILSADVPFWQFDDYRPTSPVLATVVTAAAPNLGGYDKPEDAVLFARAEEAMLRRIRYVLAAAAATGADTLILGAWGCGVFKNDPEQVATIFRHHLLSDTFINAFREVIFAVWDTEEGAPTFNTFKRILAPEESE